MNVKFFAYIRDYSHTKQTTVSNCKTVRELLQKLCSMYGDEFDSLIFLNGELRKEIIILVNGRHICHLNGLETELSENDEISVFPTVAGG